jgi:hypothetical protein
MPGNITNAPSKPAALGEPVNSSTSQGTVIITMPFPMPEAIFEVCNKINGRLCFTF